jgi:hypothetical protein
MNAHAIVRAAIASLVGGRYYPNKFPQESGAPTWPAIRGTVVTRNNAASLCGSGDEADDDVQVQLDICVSDEKGGYDAAFALRSQVRTLLEALTDPPCVRQPGGFETWDADAKVHRMTEDWVFHPSTDDA